MTALTDRQVNNFWKKVSKTSSGCWLWLSTLEKSSGGYGRYSIWVPETQKVRGLAAHRVSYELTNGELDKGLVLHHTCDNPACVNPDHLEPITQGEHVVYRSKTIFAEQVQRTHCPQGHEYTQENTRLYRGCRYCKECNLIRKRSKV